MRKIPVIMCIDVEPDDRAIAQLEKSPWSGFPLSHDYFFGLRERLAAATGSPVHYSWFLRMDPQVNETYGSASWPVLQYPQLISQIESVKDEIGLHVHPWRWSEAHQSWSADFADQTWIDHCLRSSFTTYRSAFGRECQSFRFGDRWMSNQTMEVLERLGVRFDLTLEPGHPLVTSPANDEIHTDPLPDYSNVPQVPYHPSKFDYRTPDPSRKAGLIVIPVSSGDIVPWESRLARVRRLLHLGAAPPIRLTLGMWHDPRVFIAIMNSLLKRERLPYLAFVVRSDTPIRSFMPFMEETFERILTHPWIDRFVFSTPAEAMARLGHQ
ncbi:MAG: hypothetical protein ABI882_18475 [Acidobacteriota bacterium]